MARLGQAINTAIRLSPEFQHIAEERAVYKCGDCGGTWRSAASPPKRKKLLSAKAIARNAHRRRVQLRRAKRAQERTEAALRRKRFNNGDQEPDFVPRV